MPFSITYNYNNVEKKVTIELDSDRVETWINRKTALVNGPQKELPAGCYWDIAAYVRFPDYMLGLVQSGREYRYDGGGHLSAPLTYKEENDSMQDSFLQLAKAWNEFI